MTTSYRGFQSIDPVRQREIASKGGKAAHRMGRAHEFTSEQAKLAGAKGGQIVSQDRAHMAAIGRKGGATVSADRAHMAEIGRKGGAAVAALPGHMQTLARKAGGIVSADRAHMAEIGRKGGIARHAR